MSDNGSGHTLTVENFYSTEDDELESILNRRMEYNEMKLFLIELSKSEAVRTSKPTYANTKHRDVQKRIHKIWRAYRVGGVPDLLLDMSDDERKLVLKQLGRGYEIDALLYLGTDKVYENAKKKKDDVKRMFSAIDDERRKELLNDIIYEDVLSSYKFKDLMRVLKEASVEYKEIADMLLGVKDKSLVARMIDWISTQHGDKYVVDILLSIDDNRLRSMIFDLKGDPVLAATVLSRANDIGKLRRLFNIVSSDISEQNMEIVLANIVINARIVNELIDKPEDEQNAILGGIDNIKLVDKIKCATKKAKAAIEKWIDTYASKEMTDEDKVKYIEKTQKDRLIEIFKYISENKSKANEIFGKIEEELLLRILSVLDLSLHIYFYACLDKDSAKYALKYYEQQLNDSSIVLIELVMHRSILKDIEDKKMMWRFVKDFTDNSKCKEWIIDGLMYNDEPNTKSDVLGVIVNGVKTESGYLPGLITGEFLKSIFEKESDRKKKHDIIRKVMKLLSYFKSADAAKDVVSIIIDMNDPTALVQAANNVKDKEIVYCIMEMLKQKGKLMDKEVISLLRHDIISILIYGMPDALGNLKPRLVGNEEAAGILNRLTHHDAAKILNFKSESATEILKCMRGQDKDAIDNMMEDIRLAEELNKIGANNIKELWRVFNDSKRRMTLMLFKHLDHKVASVMIDRFFNGKKSFLIELSERMEESIPEPTQASTADQHHAQIIIDKVWRVYGVGIMSDLLLDMSDKERKKVLKQLGRRYEIDVLIYVGTKKGYENAKKRKDDVRRIFDAIEDERRNRLLNDIINETSFNNNILDDPMRVLKEASIEYKKIAYMLLGVEDKRIVMNTIRRILSSHGDSRYVTNILLSIRNDDDLGNMISKLKEWPLIISRILSGANDINKLSRLFNIIKSSDTSKDYMEIVLVKIEINDNIVNELINKLEDEQNAILGGIDKQLADKIKYKVKEAQLAQLIRRESLRDILNRCALDTSKILDSSDYEELEKYEAYTKEAMRILKTLYQLVIQELKDSSHDFQTNESSGVVENRNIIGIIETINGMISGMKESMNDTGILILKDDLKSMNEKLHKMVCDMIIDTSKLDDYSTECLYELVSVMDGMMSKAWHLKWEYKELYLYDQVVMLCNEIKKRINLMESIRMLPIANTIACEIDKAVLMRYNECANRSEDENKSTSGQIKSFDEMVSKMTPEDLNSILITTVVKSMCKELVNNDHMLSNQSDKEIEETIKALPYVREIIRNCESNPLISGAQKRIRAILLAAIIVISAYSDTIIQKMKDISRPMPAIPADGQLMEVDN